jgi:hypothetical protein
MHEKFMTCNKYIPSSGFGFLLKYKVAKWSVSGKAASTVIGPAFRD